MIHYLIGTTRHTSGNSILLGQSAVAFPDEQLKLFAQILPDVRHSGDLALTPYLHIHTTPRPKAFALSFRAELVVAGVIPVGWTMNN